MQYGCETWYLILRKEQRLMVFENSILRQIIGTNMNKIRERKRLHNEEHHGLYRSPNIGWMIKSRRLRWTGHVARMKEGSSSKI